MSFTVGQLSKLSGLSIRSLHHYDETGLLSPSERSDAGYRLYSDIDVERLYQIQALRWLDLPLAEVKIILDRGGAAITEAVDNKIAALTQEIDKATDLRMRLMNLRTQHFQGLASGTEQILAAVELFKHYERHLSAQDMGGFRQPSESEIKEWRQLYENTEAAVRRNVAPDSDEAQQLSYLWGVMTYKMANGDMSLALKSKLAYENDEGVRRSSSMALGADPAVMRFVLAASHHAHLKLLANYFSPEEVTRLNLTSPWQADWLGVAVAMRAEFEKQSPVDSATVQQLATEWSKQLDAFTSGNAQLTLKLLGALRCDPHLQKRWLVNEDLLTYVQQAHDAALHGDQHQ